MKERKWKKGMEEGRKDKKQKLKKELSWEV